MSNQQPSLAINPADSAAGLKGVLRFVLRKFLQSDVDDMLPAVVVSVSDDRYWVTVRPVIMVLGTDDSLTKRAAIAKVPLLTIGAGGYLITFPIKAGDQGWIKANDRDISVYLQKQQDAGPNTTRMHSFEDGIFIPDIARTWTLADEDKENMVIQSVDGSIKVAIGADQIKVVHPKAVLIDTPLVTMTGDLDVKGTITGETDVLSGDDKISGKGHTHPGVQTGSGHTGAPDA